MSRWVRAQVRCQEGEAQRIKLASFIGKGQSADGGGTFFLFDEPTTGLHVHDIRKLVASFNKMLELGHTILVIEHNLEVIKQADWLIDLGPRRRRSRRAGGL